ncbi:MAG: hypothetical protein ACRDYC_06605, partial [Acidimicrobiales bacterium]
EKTTRLIAMLQVADALDRSHGGPVSSVRVYADTPGLVEIVVEASGEIDLELWGLRRKRELFERTFKGRLEVVDAQRRLAL